MSAAPGFGIACPAPPEPPPLSDAELARMSAEEIKRAIAAGRVPGVGPRHQGRRH